MKKTLGIRRKINNILKESEELYSDILNSYPEAVVIIDGNKIVLANNEACGLLCENNSSLIDENIYKYVRTKYIKIIHRILNEILEYKKTKVTYEVDYDSTDGKLLNIQICSSYTTYKGKPAIISVIRDITEMRKDLNSAAAFQRSSLQRCFPIMEKAIMSNVYVPAKIVSGDFYRIYKVNNDLVIGILVDVSGKGIKAALSISAFDVLFLQEVSVTHEPINIMKNLNKKLVDYYEENYVAACCFSIDFSKNQLNVVGAGINQFIIQRKEKFLEVKVVKGSFLGMFEDSIFDEQIFFFKPGDRLFFFTDGLDFILDEDKVIQRYMSKVSISRFRNFINEFLSDTLVEVGSLKDDCTMIAIEIK